MSAIETAIVLIAFVIVASVFAFSLLNSGIISTEKGREAVESGLEESTATLTLRGGVIADANDAVTAIDTIKFTLIPSAQTAESVNLSSSGAVVTYSDSNNALNCTGSGSPSCSWSANWIVGSGDLVDSGEQVEVTVTLTGLTPLLGRSTEFTIQVRPNKGAVVVVSGPPLLG